MTLSLTNSKMNIQDLPSEILEKILVEGNFLSISRVCQTWRDHAERKKSQFNDVFFDSTKDDPEKNEKEKPNQVFVFNSILFDKNNDFCMISKNKYHKDEYIIYNQYILEKYEKLFKKILSLNTLSFIFKILIYVDIHPKLKYLYFNYDLLSFIFRDNCLKQKTKTLNIEIKYVCKNIENIYQTTFFESEIDKMYKILVNLFYTFYEKFTFNVPNNNYIIYDKNKKLLIIRFGNYEKYNFPMEKITICNECNKEYIICSNNNHKHYFAYSFYRCNDNWIYNFYPARLFLFKYEKMTKNVEKLIIISSEFHDFMFDQLLELSKKEKEIEYHCLDSSKTKFEQENFEFVPVEKEKEHEYSFEQIHFKYFGKNIY